MNPQIKDALSRWAIRQLIKLIDAAEEHLQMWQVRLREQLADRVPIHLPVETASAPRPQGPTMQNPYPFPADELLRHRVSRRVPRDRERQRLAKSPRRGMTAAEFDLKFAR